MALRITELELRQGGLGIVFNNGVSTQATYEVIAGSLTLVGLTPAQLSVLGDFAKNRIDASARNYDPRFEWGIDLLRHVVDDLTPQLGGDLRFGAKLQETGWSIYDTTGSPDARGLHVFDFQLNRNQPKQVAGGDYSFIASGRNNRARGDYSFSAGGLNNKANADLCHVHGVVVENIDNHKTKFDDGRECKIAPEWYVIKSTNLLFLYVSEDK